VSTLFRCFVRFCLPGDIWRIGTQSVTRFQAMVAPPIHEVNTFVHYWFVPFRILWSGWETFISGGVNGDDASVVPRWVPSATNVGSLWDYMGFPTGVDPLGAYPLDFVRRAYNAIFNQNYRDETLTPAVDPSSENIQQRAWRKDYFTSALPWQQRGEAPALPISGTAITHAEFTGTATHGLIPLRGFDNVNNQQLSIIRTAPGTSANPALDWAGWASVGGSPAAAGVDSAELSDNNEVEVDFANASTFDVADLRLTFQIQRWLERNARAGVRYTEFLRAHWGVSPRDDRLDRPEFIGGVRAPVFFSEVLQTSESGSETPQGNMAGHGLSVNSNRAGSYRVQEYGLIMGLFSCIPTPAYQQGVPREWLYTSKFDFPSPEFVNLSEQPVQKAEIYATDVEAENTAIFGYQGRYNELRDAPNRVSGLLRTDLAQWHFGRIFASSPELNDTFIKVPTTAFNRTMAVTDQPPLIVSIGHVVDTFRPLPVIPEPGLMDHV